MGQMTELFLLEGASKVVCFDPNPDCVQMLKAKFAPNTNVEIVPKGLADKEGQLAFSICSHVSGISTFSEEWKQEGRYQGMEWDREAVVEVTTLDAMIAEYGVPAYIKIDVEGFEYRVLSGLTQPVDCVSFEFSKEFLGKTAQCLEYLQRLGFDGF